jgi:hypothetical protein
MPNTTQNKYRIHFSNQALEAIRQAEERGLWDELQEVLTSEMFLAFHDDTTLEELAKLRDRRAAVTLVINRIREEL